MRRSSSRRRPARAMWRSLPPEKECTSEVSTVAEHFFNRFGVRWLATAFQDGRFRVQRYASSDENRDPATAGCPTLALQNRGITMPFPFSHLPFFPFVGSIWRRPAAARFGFSPSQLLARSRRRGIRARTGSRSVVVLQHLAGQRQPLMLETHGDLHQFHQVDHVGEIVEGQLRQGRPVAAPVAVPQ